MRSLAKNLFAAFYGVAVALVVAYVLTYVFARFGLGIVPPADRAAPAGPAVFSRAALSLYAAQHVTLVGEGSVRRSEGSGEPASAYVVPPLTVWACLPALALALGGWTAGRRSTAASGATAVVCGLAYAAVLAFSAGAFTAKVGPDALPSHEGAGFNPPDVLFRADAVSTLANGFGFGLVFSYLGALLAARGKPGRSALWRFAKAVLIPALLLHIAIAGVLAVWFSRQGRAYSDTGGTRFYEMLPTASGIGYGLLHGAVLTVGVRSGGVGDAVEGTVASWEIGLDRGIVSRAKSKPTHRPLPAAAPAVLILTALAALVSGLLARRSLRGYAPLALAVLVTILHACLLIAISSLCRIGLGGKFAFGGLASTLDVNVGLGLGVPVLAVEIGFFVFALVGALAARPRAAPDPLETWR